MQRTPVNVDRNTIPAEFHRLLQGAKLYDSSCSPEARVLYVEKDRGYFLKSAPKGELQREAELTEYFHKKRLSAAVLGYVSAERDWLLTERIAGEDCTYARYMEDPKRLCDILALQLRSLHETALSGCPVMNRTADYLSTAARNYRKGLYDISLFPDNWGYASAEEAYRTVESMGHLLKSDTLIHGDYCLPNILLDDWRFSGFVDLGNGGVGDRHVDLFWGAWSLCFNLKTDTYVERFFDAYGREAINTDVLRVVAATEVFG